MASNQTVLDKLEEVGKDVAVIKSQLPNMSTRSDDHEKRIRSLEARTWYAIGGLGIIAFVMPLVTRWLFP